MSEETAHNCPQCGLSDQVVRVSQIYLETLAESKKPSQSHPGLNQLFAAPNAASHLPDRGSSQLLVLFAPPSEKKHSGLIRSDGILMIIGATGLFLISWISREQPIAAVPAVLLLLAAAAVYLKFRPQIISKQNGVTHQDLVIWMMAHYCARDGIVFLPNRPGSAPIEQLHEFIKNNGH